MSTPCRNRLQTRRPQLRRYLDADDLDLQGRGKSTEMTDIVPPAPKKNPRVSPSTPYDAESVIVKAPTVMQNIVVSSSISVMLNSSVSFRQWERTSRSLNARACFMKQSPFDCHGGEVNKQNHRENGERHRRLWKSSWIRCSKRF